MPGGKIGPTPSAGAPSTQLTVGSSGVLVDFLAGKFLGLLNTGGLPVLALSNWHLVAS
jgi:hypothetical protein